MALTTVPASLSATALTLTTAAQPNITSVGTLTGLTVSGNIAGTLTTAAQTNITSLGTLSALTISGDLTVDTNTLKVDSSNNRVGIGTTTLNKVFNIADPAQGGETLKLHFEAVSSNDKWAIYSYDRTNAHYTDLSFGANYLYLKSGGNIGIGTASPGFKLQLGDNTDNLGAVTTNKQIMINLDGGYSTASSLQYKVIGFSGTTNGGTDDIKGSTYSSGEQLKNFYIGLISDQAYFNSSRFSIIQGANERFVITQAGRVGIGTTTPNQNGGTGTFTWGSSLQTIAGTRPTLFLNGSSTISTLRMWARGTDGTSTSVDDWHINAVAAGSGGYLNFLPQGGAIGTVGLHLKNNGNVGINTATPAQPLTVEGSSTVARFGSSSIYHEFNSANGILNFVQSSSPLARYQVNGADILSMNGSNVGIGSTNPLKRLHVLGGSNIDTVMINNVAGNNTNRYGGITGINYAGNQSALINYYSDSGQNYLHLGSNGNTDFRGPTMMRFYTASGADTTTHTEVMRVNNSASAGHLQMGVFGVTGLNTTAAIHGAGNDSALVLSNGALAGTNSSYAYAGRGGRYLTSNGSNWTTDGSDPALVISQHTANNNRGNGLGIILHNDSNNNNYYGPIVGWGTKSESNSYNTMYAYIVGKKTGRGPDTNWSTGELQFDTAGTKPGNANTYMTDTPAMTITENGIIKAPYQPGFRARGSVAGWYNGYTASWLTLVAGSFAGNGSQVGIGLTVGGDGHLNGYDLSNDFNTTNGRFTAPLTGKYQTYGSVYLQKNTTGTGAYAHLLVYINGQQINEIYTIGAHQTNFVHAFSLNFSTVLYLESNDYVEWKLYTSSNNIQIYGAHCSLGAHYLLG